jgi:ADP-L-glycero-D-manno-heptose 6-epimerase
MASVIWHFAQQLAAHERVRLFEGSHGFAAGEQRRDFVYIDDAVEVTLWLARQPPTARGIYNCGSGRATTFNAVARAVLEWHGRGQIEYVSFPPSLIAAYQAHTEADLARLRALGYDAPMRDAARGIRDYLDWLAAVHARRV